MPATSGEPSRGVLQHCASTRHAGSLDPRDPAVGTGVAGSAAQGDLVRIQLHVLRDEIQAARFKAFGCSGSIASASLACEWAEGKTLSEAERIGQADLATALNLPAAKKHCSALAEEALRRAIRDSREKTASSSSKEVF
jgi:NifU-like protein involved in Fe-S cluster formation